ncbi:MAG: TetR/AcrR family transcriptional regulator [bacterium]
MQTGLTEESATTAPEAASQAGARLSQAERTARTRRRLLGATLELVAERGYDRASLAAIGARAGYSRGVVNHCFGSKAALLGELVAFMFQRWDHAQLRPALGDRDGIEALVATVNAVRRQAQEHPVELRAFYALLFEGLGPLPELRPRFAEFHRRLRAQTASLITRGIEAGSIAAEIDAEAQAGLFVGAFRGVMYQWLLDPEGVNFDALLDAQIRMIEIGLRPVAAEGRN